MSDMEKLAAKLRQQDVQTEQQAVSAKQLIGEWAASLNELMTQIERWVEPLRAQGLVKVARTERTMTEQPIGFGRQQYAAPVLSIDLGKVKVRLDPLGRFIMGCQGRVDIHGLSGSGEVGLIREVNDGNSTWHIMRRERNSKQAPKLEPLTSDSFASLLDSSI